MIPLLSAYKEMTINANGTYQSGSSTPTTYGYTESYATVYASSTTYKVTITEALGAENITTTTWILKSGVTLAIDISGQNLTGSEASGMAVGLFAGFVLQVQADSEIAFYTGSANFHSTGTSSVTIGSTKVTVTNYAANSLPETYTSCGSQTTLTNYSFSVGTPQGASEPLVTSEHFAGSGVSDGVTETFNYSLQITAITLA